MTSLFGTGEAVGAVDGRYNILLLGGDSGVGRTGLRPDSIQLASVDAETGGAVLFGFSRETENITFRPGSVMAGLMPEGWTCGDECLLNGLYTWGTDHAAEFPPGTQDPGLVATTEAVEALAGLDIQYYVLVDLKGFRSLVDAVGGLDIAVQRRTPIGSQREIKGWIEAGRAAPRRLPRPLVRPQPRQLHQLRADGAPALRRHRDGPPARPADGRAQLRRHREGDQGRLPHRHPAGARWRAWPTSP